MTDPLYFDDDHLTQLGLTLDFTPDDLAANRAGELGAGQITRLETDLRLTYWPVIGGLALIVLIMGTTGAASGSFPVLPVLFFMALAVIPAVMLQVERQKLPDRQVRRTLLRVGSLSLMARRVGLLDKNDLRQRAHFQVEGGRKVFGPRYLYRVLNGNRPYIVYYVAVRTWSGYRILSMEPADDSTVPSAAKPKRKGKRG